MSTEAHEPVSPTWDALRKLGEQCPHPLKVEGECLIVLDSDRRRFTDLGTPEMAQFVLASVNYVQGILAQPASPVLHNEKDLASYWKAAHDLVVAQNWELSRQIGALQKVGEQCLRPQQTPTGEGEETHRQRIAEAICDGYSNGNQPFSEAPLTVQHSCRMAAEAVMALSHPVAEKPAALAHPQQGGERDGAEPCPSIHLLRKAYDAGFAASGDGWDGDRPEAQDDPDYKRQREDEIFLIADREPVAPIQPSKSSGEEA